MDAVWSGMITALIGAVVGAFLGAYIRTWIEWLRRPKLSVFSIQRPKGRANLSILYYAIGISNEGRTSAKGATVILNLRDKKDVLIAHGRPLLSKSSSEDGSIHPNQIDEREIGSIDLDQGTVNVEGIGGRKLSEITFPLTLSIVVMAMDTPTVTTIFELDVKDSDLQMVKK